MCRTLLAITLALFSATTASADLGPCQLHVKQQFRDRLENKLLTSEDPTAIRLAVVTYLVAAEDFLPSEEVCINDLETWKKDVMDEMVKRNVELLFKREALK